MRLEFQQLQEITQGAVRIWQMEDRVCFSRFSAAQEEAYRRISENDFLIKSRGAAGIRLCFVTDSSYVSLAYRLYPGSSRRYGWFDLYVDGVMVDHFGGSFDRELVGENRTALPEGEKRVEIYFPWSAAVELLALELADGASCKAVKKSRLMLSFGDSITQGYDAIYPSLSYQSQVADRLDAVCINKAIGGDFFFPGLLEEPEGLSPDLITVAYGTNNWSKRQADETQVDCQRFYTMLAEQYPNARIFAITPLWRGDFQRITPFGAPIERVTEMIVETCREIPGATVVYGGDMLPRIPEFYSDGYLHPNDLGFDFYARKLSCKILETLY